MNGNADYDSQYLHDPGAERDPDIQALEDALRPLQFVRAAPSERVLSAAPKRNVWPWLVAATTAAAAMWLWLVSTGDALYPGCAQRTFVCKKAELRVDLGGLAAITLRPGSELQFVHWRKGEQALFRLKRGGMRAVVVPPPRVKAGFFVVESPRGTVVDQGCTYELVIDKSGATRVYVEAGAVTFANQERTVWVPAGARAVVGPEGVRTPTFIAAAPVIKKLVDRIDKLRHSKDSAAYSDVVRKLVAACSEPRDTLPLWHLLADGDLAIAKEATDGLFRLVGPPDGKSSMRMFPADQWLQYLREVAW